jgi:hypothetical protein
MYKSYGDIFKNNPQLVALLEELNFSDMAKWTDVIANMESQDELKTLKDILTGFRDMGRVSQSHAIYFLVDTIRRRIDALVARSVEVSRSVQTEMVGYTDTVRALNQLL